MHGGSVECGLNQNGGGKESVLTRGQTLKGGGAEANTAMGHPACGQQAQSGVGMLVTRMLLGSVVLLATFDTYVYRVVRRPRVG